MKNLKTMLKADKPLVIPGVYDAIGAKIAEKVGFEAMFQTGYGTSATLFGMPDYGFIGATETLDNAKGLLMELSLTPLYDGQHLWRDIVDRLESLGFILWTMMPAFSDIKSGQTLQFDAIFIKNN